MVAEQLGAKIGVGPRRKTMGGKVWAIHYGGLRGWPFLTIFRNPSLLKFFGRRKNNCRSGGGGKSTRLLRKFHFCLSFQGPCHFGKWPQGEIPRFEGYADKALA